MEPGTGATVGVDSDDDVEVAAVLEARRVALRRRAVASVGGVRRRRRYRGSISGRKPNRQRDFAAGLNAILRDYLGLDGAPPDYHKRDFEWRFRVPRAVFMRLYNAPKD